MPSSPIFFVQAPLSKVGLPNIHLESSIVNRALETLPLYRPVEPPTSSPEMYLLQPSGLVEEKNSQDHGDPQVHQGVAGFTVSSWLTATVMV